MDWLKNREIDMSASTRHFENPENITFEEALEYIRGATACFHENRHADFINEFATGARIRYASFPEMHGRDELQKWMSKRIVRQQNYKMEKRAVASMRNIICATWEGVWNDAVTGQNMQCQAAEVITIQRDGLISDWYVAMSVWEKGGSVTTPLT